jgi:hypothetical protein
MNTEAGIPYTMDKKEAEEHKHLVEFTCTRMNLIKNHISEFVVYTDSMNALLRLLNHWNSIGTNCWKYWI